MSHVKVMRDVNSGVTKNKDEDTGTAYSKQRTAISQVLTDSESMHQYWCESMVMDLRRKRRTRTTVASFTQLKTQQPILTD